MYEKIEKLIKSEKSNKHLIVMGDWNAVGEEKSGNLIGKYGLGRKVREKNNFWGTIEF